MEKGGGQRIWTAKIAKKIIFELVRYGHSEGTSFFQRNDHGRDRDKLLTILITELSSFTDKLPKRNR